MGKKISEKGTKKGDRNDNCHGIIPWQGAGWSSKMKVSSCHSSRCPVASLSPPRSFISERHYIVSIQDSAQILSSKRPILTLWLSLNLLFYFSVLFYFLAYITSWHMVHSFVFCFFLVSHSPKPQNIIPWKASQTETNFFCCNPGSKIESGNYW